MPGAARRVQFAPRGKQPRYLPSHRRRGIDDFRPPRRHCRDERRQMREMRAPQHQMVRPRRQQRLDFRAHHRLGMFPFELALLDERTAKVAALQQAE